MKQRPSTLTALALFLSAFTSNVNPARATEREGEDDNQ